MIRGTTSPRRRRAAAAGTLAVGAGLVLALLALQGPPSVHAASPEPSSDAGGDTRSAGEGPGLVGAPGLAIGGVILLGVVSAGLTVAYIRLTGGPVTTGGSAAAAVGSTSPDGSGGIEAPTGQPARTGASPPPLGPAVAGSRVPDPPKSDPGSPA